jgi:FtsP/CotA-like multicopper oxidase with cupredoxin domain
LAPFTVSIDEHPLRIIEVEGENIQPREFNKINIAVGQRYSVIVNCDKDVKNFWIRATIVKECIHRNNNTINHNSALNYEVVGVLRYQGAPTDEDPTTEDWDEIVPHCRDMDHNMLELFEPRPVPEPVTDFFVWEIDFGRDENDVLIGLINNSTFVADVDNPTINKVMYGGTHIGKLLEPDQNDFHYDTEDGVVEIALISK